MDAELRKAFALVGETMWRAFVGEDPGSKAAQEAYAVRRRRGGSAPHQDLNKLIEAVLCANLPGVAETLEPNRIAGSSIIVRHQRCVGGTAYWSSVSWRGRGVRAGLAFASSGLRSTRRIRPEPN